MSLRADKVLALAGGDLLQADDATLSKLFRASLEAGMHGLGFSAYETEQEPGSRLTEAQIRRKLNVVKPYTQWIRVFSCTEGHELIPGIAKEMGFKVLLGAWLGTDREKNEGEINSLIALANQGLVDIAAVGNEVLYRGDLEEGELLDYIYRVREALPDIPVGYVDAYYEFSNRPALVDASDVILANCYPFWEGCPAEFALLYMKDMYARAQRAGLGKKVIVTETGWPSQGQSLEGAVPSRQAAIRYFLQTQEWSREEGIEVFYFSAFDEPWKTGAEGDVGAYWGLWDGQENLKY